MLRSESIANLAPALVEAQSEFPQVAATSVNDYNHNRYADMGAFVEAARPILTKHGLAVTQLTSGGEGYIGVETVLLHKSGEWISSTAVLPLVEEKGKSAAQVAGSIVNYLRRYGFASILGLYTDGDSDGQAGRRGQSSKPANGQARRQPEPVNGASPAGGTPPPAKVGNATPAPAPSGRAADAADPSGPVTPGQLSEIWRIGFQGLRWNQEQIITGCRELFEGKPPTKLTGGEAVEFIEALKNRLTEVANSAPGGSK